MSSNPVSIFSCRFRPSLYPAYMHEMLRRQITVATIWLLPLAIAAFVVSNDPQRHPDPDWRYQLARLILVVLVTAPFAALMTFAVYRSLKKVKRDYYATVYNFTPAAVIRTDFDGRQTTFDLQQIASTQRIRNKGIFLNTGKPGLFLFIPQELENFDAVVEFLETGRRQERELSRMPLQFQYSLTNSAVIICWLIALISPIRWTAIVGGSLAAGWCLFVVWNTRRNPNCTTSAKRAAWIWLALAAVMLYQVFLRSTISVR